MDVVELEMVHDKDRCLNVTRGDGGDFCDQKAVNDSGYRLQFPRGKSHVPRAGRRTWPRCCISACVLQPVPGMGRNRLLCFQPLNEQGSHRAACAPAQLSARPVSSDRRQVRTPEPAGHSAPPCLCGAVTLALRVPMPRPLSAEARRAPCGH